MLSYSSLSSALAAERERALREKARTAWERRQRGELRLRYAAVADARALHNLARLDSARPLEGATIVAEDRGELVAAIAVESGEVIANPFRATASVVAMLRLRAEQVSGPSAPSRRRRWLSPLRPSLES